MERAVYLVIGLMLGITLATIPATIKLRYYEREFNRLTDDFNSLANNFKRGCR